MSQENTKAVVKLSKYGFVRTCKIIKDSVVTIVVTTDFNEKAINTFDFLKDCTELFPNYPKLETCITENNFAMLVLTS